MTLNVLLRCVVPKFNDAFVYLIDGMIMLMSFFNADIDAVFLAFCGVCH